jgi:ABC-type polysaccharide/polyol phosphate transport system ATPase subunit/ABC-type polysaccharide/polyol phosphate export permease
VSQIKLKYRYTFLGLLWNLLEPGLYLLVLSAVLSFVNRMDMHDYAVFLFSGLIPWRYFEKAVGVCMDSLVQGDWLLKKLPVSAFALPLARWIVASVEFAFAFLAGALVLLALKPGWSVHCLALPVSVVPWALLGLGLGLLTASLFTFFRDLRPIVQMALLLLFFTSPILFHADLFPAGSFHARLLAWHPVTYFAALFQKPLHAGTWPSATDWTVSFTVALLALGVGASALHASRRRLSLRHALASLFRRRPSEWHEALSGVDLVVRRGEHVGVIGRNGAGKSTLLRVMARVIVPQRGRLSVDPDARVVPLLELGIGFQPDLSGYENCHLAGALLGYSSREIEERLPGIAAFSELGSFLHEPVRTYSSGMYARLGFALATDVEPDVLLIDEVFGVGDEFFMARCAERIRGLMSGGTTTVFVSHDLEFLLARCQRLVWLDQGRVVDDGEPEAVAQRYRACSGRLPGSEPWPAAS